MGCILLHSDYLILMCYKVMNKVLILISMCFCLLEFFHYFPEIRCLYILVCRNTYNARSSAVTLMFIPLREGKIKYLNENIHRHSIFLKFQVGAHNEKLAVCEKAAMSWNKTLQHRVFFCESWMPFFLSCKMQIKLLYTCTKQICNGRKILHQHIVN